MLARFVTSGMGICGAGVDCVPGRTQCDGGGLELVSGGGTCAEPTVSGRHNDLSGVGGAVGSGVGITPEKALLCLCNSLRILVFIRERLCAGGVVDGSSFAGIDGSLSPGALPDRAGR